MGAGSFAAGLLRGYSTTAAQQEAQRRSDEDRERALAVDFWSNIVGREDLTPEGRQFALSQIGNTLGAKPSKGFGGMRRKGKGNEFDIASIMGKFLEMDKPTVDFDSSDTVSGTHTVPGLGDVPIEGPRAQVRSSRLFTSPEERMRSEFETKAGLEEEMIQRRIQSIDKLGLSPWVTERLKGAMLTGHMVTSEPRAEKPDYTDFEEEVINEFSKGTYENVADAQQAVLQRQQDEEDWKGKQRELTTSAAARRELLDAALLRNRQLSNELSAASELGQAMGIQRSAIAYQQRAEQMAQSELLMQSDLRDADLAEAVKAKGREAYSEYLDRIGLDARTLNFIIQGALSDPGRRDRGPGSLLDE